MDAPTFIRAVHAGDDAWLESALAADPALAHARDAEGQTPSDCARKLEP